MAAQRTVIELRPGIRPTDHRLTAEFHQGQLAFLRGAARPPTPAADEDLTPRQARWLGWMLERARKLMAEDSAERRREAVRDYVENGADLPSDL